MARSPDKDAASGATLSAADLELVFNAALADPRRLRAAVSGEQLGPYSEARS